MYASPTLAIIGGDSGLSPVRHQAIIWTNAVVLPIEPLETHFSQIIFEIQIFALKEMRSKMPSEKCQPFWLGLNVLNHRLMICSTSLIGLRVQVNDYCLPFYYVTRFPSMGLAIRLNTIVHLPLDKMAAISQTIFQGAYFWMKNCVFGLKVHRSLFLRVKSTITQRWLR